MDEAERIGGDIEAVLREHVDLEFSEMARDGEVELTLGTFLAAWSMGFEAGVGSVDCESAEGLARFRARMLEAWQEWQAAVVERGRKSGR